MGHGPWAMTGLWALGPWAMEMAGQCAHACSRSPPTCASTCDPICGCMHMGANGATSPGWCAWPICACVNGARQVCVACLHMSMAPVHAACANGAASDTPVCVASFVCMRMHAPIWKLLFFPPGCEPRKVGDLCFSISIRNEKKGPRI